MFVDTFATAERQREDSPLLGHGGAFPSWFALVALIAIAYRGAWAMLRHTPYATGEAANVAVALAQGRGFADAFAVGQGPSAHVLPLGPMMGGLIYATFGVHSVLSEFLLFGWSIFLVACAYTLLAKCMLRLGTPKTGVLIGLALLALLPVYTTKETFDFRVWDGALGLALAATLLNLILAVEDGAVPRGRHIWLAILPALTFFVSPPLGLAAMLALSLFLWRQRGRVRVGRICIGLLLTAACLFGPWAMRNERMLGSAIWLRDDLGLELAVANYPAAEQPVDASAALDSRLQAVHPRNSDQAYRAMQSAGGEVQYSRALFDTTLRWMTDHPGAVVRIWLRHAKEMLLTSPWMFQDGPPGMLAKTRSVIVALASVLGLLGLALGLRREIKTAYVALFVLVPTVCYLPFQPISRYTWLIYPLLMLFATDVVVRAYQANHLSSRFFRSRKFVVVR